MGGRGAVVDHQRHGPRGHLRASGVDPEVVEGHVHALTSNNRRAPARSRDDENDRKDDAETRATPGTSPHRRPVLS